MVKATEINESNSYNLCEPDCPHLKQGPFGRTAKCTYYNKELVKWAQSDGAPNIGQSKWFVCGACYEACFDDPYFREIEDRIEDIESNMDPDTVRAWRKDFERNGTI